MLGGCLRGGAKYIFAQGAEAPTRDRFGGGGFMSREKKTFILPPPSPFLGQKASLF